MIFLFIIGIVVISSVVRLIELPFRLGRLGRGSYYGGGYPGYGYGYGYGYRRRRGAGHLIVVLLVLFFLSHFFGHHHHHSF